MTKRSLSFLAAGATLFLAFPGSSRAVDFNREVRPILSDKCFACHGFDVADRKADLRLDTREGAFADLGGYAAVVAGKPDDSYFVELCELPEDDDEVMPPVKNGDIERALCAKVSLKRPDNILGYPISGGENHLKPVLIAADSRWWSIS